MAVLSVPRPLQERLGDVATASLVEMLRQFEDDQEERREVQKEHLFQLLEERFLRHVAESEQRTRKEISGLRVEIADVRGGLGKEIADVRQEVVGVEARLSNEITDVRTEIAGVRTEIAGVRTEIAGVEARLRNEITVVHKEIVVQTRWIVAVMAAAAVLIPVMLPVMEAIIP
jgi:predicted  nucleic acid-binding Zn-ribbon protein